MSHISKDLFNTEFEKVLNDYKARGLSILLSHNGVLSLEQVNDYVFNVEEGLKESNVKKGVVKRIFSALIEALQNLRLHGESDPEGVKNCYVILGADEGHFYISTANLIRNQNKEKVSGRIDHINELHDNGGLKEYYMDTLTDGKISDKGGAGLGFITIVMKSKNTLDYDYIQVDDTFSLFQMASVVDLKKKQQEEA